MTIPSIDSPQLYKPNVSLTNHYLSTILIVVVARRTPHQPLMPGQGAAMPRVDRQASGVDRLHRLHVQSQTQPQH
jgi:hypothetical protein